MGQEKTQRENSREQRKKDREDCRRMSLRVILWGSRVRGCGEASRPLSASSPGAQCQAACC